MHPSRKPTLICIMIPEVWVHKGKLVMLEVRREDLVTIERLCPPITNGRGGGVPLSCGITTGGGGRDKRVWGRHL